MLPELFEEVTHHQGLEPTAQYLLAALLVGRPVHGGGERLPASSAGARLLQELTGVPTRRGVGVVADHPLRAAPEIGVSQGAVPDFAIFWPGRVALIEVKTDHRAERPGQITRYAALGRHHYPKLDVDLVYILRDPTGEPAPKDVGWRKLLWIDVAEAVRRAFASSHDPVERARAKSYADWFDQNLQPVTWQATSGADAVPTTEQAGPPDIDAALAVAREAEERGEQSVYEYAWADAVEARAFADSVSAAMPPGLKASVIWWVWTPTSTGRPRSPTGAAVGVELRVSPRRARETE